MNQTYIKLVFEYDNFSDEKIISKLYEYCIDVFECDWGAGFQETSQLIKNYFYESF